MRLTLRGRCAILSHEVALEILERGGANLLADIYKEVGTGSRISARHAVLPL